MHNNILVLLLLLIEVASCAQSEKMEESIASPYRYYQSLFEEVKRVDGDSQKLTEIEEIITSVPYSFSRDVVKALDLSLVLRNDEVSAKLGLLLLKRGCPKSYFVQPKFDGFRKSNSWSKLVGFMSDEVSYSPAAREAFESIYQLDQLIASNFINANVHPLYPEVTKRFKAFVDQYGFPSEQLIGVRMVDDLTIGTPHYYVVMLHHYHMSSPLMLEEFDKLKASGELDYRHAERFASNVVDKELADRMNSQREWRPKRIIKQVTVYTDNKKPVCEEEYLYVKEQKEVVETKPEAGVKLVYLDWNGDSIFNEPGVDFFGFVNNDESYSCFNSIQKQNKLAVNEEFYQAEPLNYLIEMIPASEVGEEDNVISFSTEAGVLELEDGSLLNLKDYPKDKSIVYFYATWCKPCIKTLVAYNEANCEQDFNFIPIALESSQSSLKKLFANKNFKFGLLTGAESLKSKFEVKSFPMALLVSFDGVVESKMTGAEVKEAIKSEACR